MMLTVEKGSFSYGKNTILKEIDFAVGSGDLMAILGPNGAGKTTLLRCIMGMLKWKEGRSAIDGENIAAMSARSLWQKVAYVPQARTTGTSATALQTVLLGRSSRLNLFEQPKKEDIEYAMEVLARLGIEQLVNKSCLEMSGGELQMVLIARALVSEPQILILDEPESNLDFKNQLIVLNTMSALAEGGLTCIFNTHYPAHALQRANKALILHKGGEYSFGATSDIVTEENIEAAFGVRTAIGAIETDHAQLQSVVPLNLAPKEYTKPRPDQDTPAIGALTIIFEDNDKSIQINEILHEYGDYIIGRMGMPYKPAGMYIINVTLDAPQNIIRRLSQRISIIQGVSAKLTFAKQGKEAAGRDD